MGVLVGKAVYVANGVGVTTLVCMMEEGVINKTGTDIAT
jgi:hypothetical protein